MTKWLTLILVALIGYNILSSTVDAQGSGTINQLSPFQVSGGVVRLASTTAGFRIPSLQSISCLGTDSNGNLQLGLCTGGGGGGGTDTLFNWNQSTNIISTDGVSTTATTSLSTNGFTANNATITNATSTTGWFSSMLRAASAIFTSGTSTNWFATTLNATTGTIASLFGTNAALTNATTTNIRTTQLGVGSDYITDLTGTGLSVVGNALTVTNDHAAVTVSGARDYITLSGQDIVRGVVDISDDTNLSADGTEIVLTGDALSLGNSLTFTSATATGFASTFSTTSVFYGAGLTDCSSASNALTWSNGSFGCNTILGGGGGGGGGWATTTDNNAEVGELIAYTPYDAYIGGSSSSTANFNFDQDSTTFTIGTPTSVATGSILTQYGVLLFGSSTAETVNLDFRTSDVLRLTSATGVLAFDLGDIKASSTNASTSALTVHGNIFSPKSDGCASWSSGVLTTTGTACGSGGGGGSISTSSVPTAGNLAYWTSGSALSDVATGTLTETVTGLELSATRGLVGGSAILSLTSGYTVPTTSSTTEWSSFYQTPSTRITDGTGLTWSSNTLNCDTANGSTQGCLTAIDWTSFNGKVSSTSIDTLAELETLMSGINIIQSTEIDTSSELATILTDETGTGNVVFSASPTFTGNMTIANASSTNMSIATGINLFGGGYKTTANALCIQLTGSAGLCDGTDDGGAGGSPAGSDTYVQYNNGGSFGAVESATNGLRWMSGSDQVLVGTTSNTGAKFEIDNTNASFTSPMFSVFSNSTSGANADLLIQSPDADIEFCRDGIASPSDCFEITSSAGNNALFFTPRNAADSSYEYPALTIKRLGTNDYGVVGVGTQYDTPGATLEVINVPGQTNIFAATSDLTATEGNRFVVAENGMVGIGNTSPNVLLSLATSSGSASHNFLKLENTGAFAEGGAGILFNNSAGTIDMARLYARPGSSYTDASLIFSVANSSKTLTERMRIDVNGRLGIGSTTPGHLLTVAGGNLWVGGNITATGTLGINSETFSDLTGFGLANSGGSLGLDTTGAADGECLTYSSTGPAISWASCGGAGGSKWTDSGTFTYLTDSTDDIAFGSSATTSAPFWWDMSATTTYIGNGGAGDSVLTLGPTGTEWTMGFDDTDDSFSISTSTSLGTSPFLHFSATSSILYSTSPLVLSEQESGARIGINTSTYYGGSILDHVVINGRRRNAGWYIVDCPITNGVAISADGTTSCDSISFYEDGTETLTALAGNGYTYSQLGGALANGGAGVFVNGASAGWLRLATSTPSMEVTARIGTIAANSSTTQYFIGYSNIATAGSTYETAPSAGCFFTASSTRANWIATCRTALGTGTVVDTGIASTSVSTGAGKWNTFRIDADATHAVFWIKNGDANMVKVADISTTYPSTTALNAGIHWGRTTGTQAIQFDFFGLNVQWRKFTPNL